LFADNIDPKEMFKYIGEEKEVIFFSPEYKNNYSYKPQEKEKQRGEKNNWFWTIKY